MPKIFLSDRALGGYKLETYSLGCKLNLTHKEDSKDSDPILYRNLQRKFTQSCYSGVHIGY